jgi:hypothetical protein
LDLAWLWVMIGTSVRRWVLPTARMSRSMS